MLSKNVLCHGKEEPLVKPIQLRSGDLQMIFDTHLASLRYVRLGDHEIVRNIYGAIRDRDWNTVPPTILHLQPESTGNGFRLAFDVECKAGNIDFLWRGTITGDARGEIVFSFDGEARSTFFRNRIGLCVLHPITECAGKLCGIHDASGRVTQGHFPRHISPPEPFLKNIRSLSYEIVPGVYADVLFEGDVFETEDQRNWTDASFKTYSPPVELPCPVLVAAGTRIRQSVTLSLRSGSRQVLPVLQGRTPQFSVTTSTVLGKPPLGLCVASHGQPMSGRELERLKKLRLSHLRVDLRLSDPTYPLLLRQATHESNQLEASLQVALFLTERAEEELTHFVLEVQEVRPKVSLWIVFDTQHAVTSEASIGVARQKLSPFGPNILIAAGSKTDFSELNQNRPAINSSALPCYSINPQAHASDDLTIVENLAAQSMTVESLCQFCPRPAVISPIKLRPRSMAPGRIADPTSQDELPSDIDVRQMSLLGAGWTLGSIARLVTSGHIHSLTYYETTGRRGVMETEADLQMPGQFPSLPGAVFPVYHVLAEIAEFDRIYPTHSSHPLQTDGLTLVDAQNRRRILIANLIGEEQEVKIKTGTCQARLRYLDERNAEEAMRSPQSFREAPGDAVNSEAGKIGLKLLPYALAVVDIS